MDEPQYVIYDDCSALALQENDGSKIVTVSNNFPTSSACVSPRTTSPSNQLMKDDEQTLSQSHIGLAESKSGCISHISVLPSNVFPYSIISLQDDEVLSDKNRLKNENTTEMILTNPCYEMESDSSSTSAPYRLLLASLPYSTVINLSDKETSDQTLLTSSSPTPGIISSESLADIGNHAKDEQWVNENGNSLVFNTGCPSSSHKKDKNESQSQVVVKLLQDDLNLDMVEIISPNLDSSQIFEIIDKDVELSHNQESEVRNDIIASGNLKLITHNNKIIQQPTGNAKDISTASIDLPYTCSVCAKVFSSKTLYNHHKRMCLPYSSNIEDDNLDNYNENDLSIQSTNISSIDKQSDKKPMPNLVWICLICSQEWNSNYSLKLHYASHSVEQLASALLKFSLPVKQRTEKLCKNNNLSVECKSVNENLAAENNSASILSNSSESKTIPNGNDSSISFYPEVDSQHISSKPSTVKATIEVSPEAKSMISAKNQKSKPTGKSKAKSGLKSRDPHSCPICKKILSSRGNLAKHLIQHESVKPWVCKVCGSGFNSKRNYDHHYMQRHTTLRPSVCHICGKGYSNKTTLTEHMMFHKKEREFRCILCNKGFRTQKCVNRHMQRHVTSRKFVCDLCFKGFMVKVDLISHLKIVHNVGGKKAKCKPSKTHSSTHNSNKAHEGQVSQYEQSCQNSDIEGLVEVPTCVKNPDIQKLPMTKHHNLSKIKVFPDLLQSHTNTVIPSINNEFQCSSLNRSRSELLFENNENIDQELVIPVPSNTKIAHKNYYSNLYNLHNKDANPNQDIYGNSTYVLIGISGPESGTEINSHEFKIVSQNGTPKKSIDSQNVTEISLLPTVLENISSTYNEELEESAKTDNSGLSKPLRRDHSIEKCVGDKCFDNSISEMKTNEKSIVDTITNDTQAQTLSLDLISQTLQLPEFQCSNSNIESGFL